jgi:DNA-binding transcriptional ArsR family regulator
MLTLSTRVDAMGRLGRALADPSRCRILLKLADEPQFPGALADDLGLTRSNVSNHLSCLRGCGLVVASPVGRRVRYELADATLADVLESIFTLQLAATCSDAGCTHAGCCG